MSELANALIVAVTVYKASLWLSLRGGKHSNLQAPPQQSTIVCKVIRAWNSHGSCRYVDLIVNEEVRGTLKARARMMGALRRTLEERGFLEVRRSAWALVCQYCNLLCLMRVDWHNRWLFQKGANRSGSLIHEAVERWCVSSLAHGCL